MLTHEIVHDRCDLRKGGACIFNPFSFLVFCPGRLHLPVLGDGFELRHFLGAERPYTRAGFLQILQLRVEAFFSITAPRVS